ncbi:hypothetical protein [Pseudonocardia acaciae]|uniref:phage tail termination protein n=1 Tax=Pseudonocardia acaciae TaxID=551276 RepID=UPI00048F8B9C|nr:hypothetical protein [Pseudonocardia acaciae]
MTVPARVMPDAEEIVVAYLDDALPGTNVVTELRVGFEDKLPVVRVCRVGGAVSKPLILDAPLVDVDAYHRTRAQASQLAREIAAAMSAARGVALAGGLVTSVTEQVGPSWRPDYNPRVHHFGCQFVLTIRPAT